MAKKKLSDLVKGNSEDPTLTAQEIIDSGAQINSVPTGTGLFNTPLYGTPFTYDTPAGASQLENKGAYIVFGQVPPSGKTSGYGAKGIPASSIDLVVGRHSSTYGGKGPKEGSVIDNNFSADAARIYISRLCDIDQIFGLESSPTKKEGRGLIARSGIGIKADGVRIIGREGVKITTGKMRGGKLGPKGETNSLGGVLESKAPKIELVAGNNYSLKFNSKDAFDQVQGVALGKRTELCISELNDIIGELWSAVFNMTLIQIGVNIPLGVSPLPWQAPAVAYGNSQYASKVLTSLYQTRVNSTLWKNRYIGATADRYIVSKNVKTN